MRNPVIAVMLVIVLGFLVSHGVMVGLSMTSQPGQIEERRQTPDLAAGLQSAEDPAEERQ